MEQNKVIFSSKLTGYRPIIWLGEAVFKRENQIRTVLKDKLGEEYSELFSNVIVHSETVPDRAAASWMSGYLIPVSSLDRLKEPQKSAIRERLRFLISRISDLCAELKKSGNKEYEELSEIIMLATFIPSESCILTDGQKITLVLWGFIPDGSDHKGIELMKFLGYVFPEVDMEKDPVLIVPPVQEKTADPIPIESITAPVVTSQIVSVENPPIKEKKKSRFRWWWLLILLGILMLLLLLFFLLRGCSRNGILPDKPGVVPPIDTTQIIKNPGDTLQRPVIGNRLNVILDKNTDLQKFADDFATQFGSDAKIIYYDSLIMQIQVEFYTDDIPTWKTKIKALPGVRIVFEESIFHSNFAPSDPAFGDARSNYYFAAIKAYGGWDVTRGKNSIIIAVIDDGFDLNHPELQGKFINPWNVVENAPNVNTNGGKCIHGTHVACLTVGNINNAAGASGIAPECVLMPIQISDAGGNMSTTYIINGFLYAINQGADVINMSLGMRWPSFVTSLSPSEQQELARTLYPEEAEFWEEMYAYAEDYNVVVVQAAGNDDVLAAIDPMKRSEKTIVVSSSDQRNEKSDFSNYGERSDVTAPGTQIFSAIPKNQYALMDGTSMASPIVAGAAALLLCMNENLSSADVKKILIQTGIQVTSPAGKTMGPLIQLDKALQAVATFQPMTCDEMVDSLLNVIDRLKQKVCDTSDKMKMPDQALDCSFTKGQWVSSNNLVNSLTKTPVQLFFDFDGNCNGQLTYSEQGGNRCHASVKCKISGRKMIITQDGNASCDNGTEYNRHVFDCVPDNKGVLQCSAKRAGSNTVLVKFTLNRL